MMTRTKIIEFIHRNIYVDAFLHFWIMVSKSTFDLGVCPLSSYPNFWTGMCMSIRKDTGSPRSGSGSPSRSPPSGTGWSPSSPGSSPTSPPSRSDLVPLLLLSLLFYLLLFAASSWWALILFLFHNHFPLDWSSKPHTTISFLTNGENFISSCRPILKVRTWEENYGNRKSDFTGSCMEGLRIIFKVDFHFSNNGRVVSFVI